MKKEQAEQHQLVTQKNNEAQLELDLMKKIHVDSSNSWPLPGKAFVVEGIDPPSQALAQQCLDAANQAMMESDEEGCKGERKGQIWLMGRTGFRTIYEMVWFQWMLLEATFLV